MAVPSCAKARWAVVHAQPRGGVGTGGNWGRGQGRVAEPPVASPWGGLPALLSGSPWAGRGTVRERPVLASVVAVLQEGRRRNCFAVILSRRIGSYL